MFRNEGSAASVNVTEKEDSRVGVSQNKPSTSSPLESPRKRPKLSMSIPTSMSCSSSESDRRDIDNPQSEGAESTQNIIDELNSRLRSSPHDMFGNESENDDNSRQTRFRNLDLTPRVTVQKLSSTLQHFHTTQTFEITPLILPPLSLPVTERVTPSKSGGGTGGGTQQETGSSPTSQPSTPIMVTPPDHSSESSAEGGSGSGNRGRGRGRGRRPGLTTLGGINALLKKRRKASSTVSPQVQRSNTMPMMSRSPDPPHPAPLTNPSPTGSNETTTTSRPTKPVGRHAASAASMQRRQNMTKEELAAKYKHLRNYFVIDSVVTKKNSKGKESYQHVFQCVLCKPKITKLKCSYDTRANLKRHMQSKHGSKHYTGFIVADSLNKVKQLEGKGKEDADDPAEQVVEELENQPMTIQKSSIYIQKKRNNAIVDFFVDNFISLRVVESPSFNKMMMANNSTYQPISRRTLMRLIGDRHHFINEKLRR